MTIFKKGDYASVFCECWLTTQLLFGIGYSHTPSTHTRILGLHLGPVGFLVGWAKEPGRELTPTAANATVPHGD